MSVNNRYGVDQKKVRKYGKYFGSIDFDCNQKISADLFRKSPERPVIGTFVIGNHSFDVTWDELEYIEETAKRARETTMKRYRMGMMGKLSS